MIALKLSMLTPQLTPIYSDFVPIGRILRKTTLKACLDYYKTLGDAFYEQLCSMLVFDALIYNEDRHFGNFGLLRNNHTGEIIAPISESQKTAIYQHYLGVERKARPYHSLSPTACRFFLLCR